MVADIGEVKRHIKPKADGTLRNMRKEDLIGYIRCLENNYNVAVSFNENQAKYIESLDAVEVVRGQWIPVAERLPELIADNYEGEKIETSKYVLGYNVRGGTVERVYLEIFNGVMYWADEPGTTYKITHWMPLPEPPEATG